MIRRTTTKNAFSVYCKTITLVAILVGAILGALPWVNDSILPHATFPPPAELPLGAEYFQIGKSVGEGRGFSSPFRIPSGPTAWMPPALPVVLSVLYLLSGRDEFWTAVLFQFFGTGCVIGSWLAALRFAEKAGIGILHISIGFLVCLYSQWQEIFLSMHDGPILMFVASLILLGCYEILTLTRIEGVASKITILWGVLGGLTSLLSPSLLLGWIACTTVSHWRFKKQAVVVICLAGLIHSPWLVRNYMFFGKLIPIKSNAVFEAALARSSATGVLTPASFEHHPYVDVVEAERHAVLGETEYIRVRSQEMTEANHDAVPLAYQIAQRASAYFVRNSSWMASFDQLVLYTLPLLFCMLHLAVGRSAPQPIGSVLALWIAYGIPYIAISFYERYAVPMLPARLMCVALGLQTTLDAVRQLDSVRLMRSSMRFAPLALFVILCIFGLPMLAFYSFKNWEKSSDQIQSCFTYVFGLTILMACGMLFLTRIQIGFRYALPLFPLVIIWSAQGIYSTLIKHRRVLWFRFLAGVILVAQFVISLNCAPRYLSYVSSIAGGPQNGYRLMADSNVDWGQDLPALRETLDSLPSKRVVLSYFGSANPEAYGVNLGLLDESLANPLDGYDFLAISVNHLYGLQATSTSLKPTQYAFLETQPFARAGDSILIYDLRSNGNLEFSK